MVTALAAALGATVALIVFAQGQYDRRRVQARKVNAWAVAVLPKRETNERGAKIGMPGMCVEVQAHNTSGEPVYDFSAWVHQDYSLDSPIIGSANVPLLPPASTTIYVDGVSIPESGLAHEPYVDVTFRDSAGRPWRRLHNGDLRRDTWSPEARRALLQGPWWRSWWWKIQFGIERWRRNRKPHRLSA